nr:hypothetical protein BaRGS_007992 [Batillaria attramentaria]
MDGPFVWDKEMQGLLLGAIYWGYMLFQVIGGYLFYYGGPRLVCGLSVPWLKILTSLCFWAMVSAHVSFTWGLFLFLSNLPIYMREVMRFDIKSNGVFSMLPYIALGTVQFCGGFISDAVVRRKLLNVFWSRRMFCVIVRAEPCGAFFIVVVVVFIIIVVVIIIIIIIISVGLEMRRPRVRIPTTPKCGPSGPVFEIFFFFSFFRKQLYSGIFTPF